MWPLASPWQVGIGDRGDSLQPGDLLAVIGARPGTVLVHRLVKIDGDWLILRGDTNGYDDAPVPRDALVGRVQALRLGRMVLTEPRQDATLGLVRQLGVGWAHLAPQLRAAVRWARAKTRRNAPDC
jgi:hypothetical protein